MGKFSLLQVIFNVYVPPCRHQAGPDNMFVIIQNRALSANVCEMMIRLHHQGDGIWKSATIPTDGQMAFAFSGNTPDTREKQFRYLTEDTEQYSVFKRSCWNDSECSRKEFKGHFAFVKQFYKFVEDGTKTLSDCLTLTHRLEFGKTIPKTKIAKLRKWIRTNLLTVSDKNGMAYLIVLLGQLTSYNPKDIKPREILESAMRPETFHLSLTAAFAFRDINEIPECAKSHLRTIGQLLADLSRYKGRLGFLAIFSGNFHPGDLSQIVSEMESTPDLSNQVFNELLAFANNQVRHACNDVTKEVIARHFSQDAPSLMSLLRCGSTFGSVCQSSADLANFFADIFVKKSEEGYRITDLYNATTVQLWNEIPVALRTRIEGVFLSTIINSIQGKMTWSNGKIEFARSLLLGDVFRQPNHIAEVVQIIATTESGELFDLMIDVLDSDKFMPTWGALGVALKEELCFKCCQRLSILCDEKADKPTVINSLAAVKRICKAKSVRDDAGLKQGLKERVMRCLEEHLKQKNGTSGNLSSFLEAYGQASKDPNISKKLYVQGLKTAFQESAGDPHRKLKDVLVTIGKDGPAASRESLCLDRYLGK